MWGGAWQGRGLCCTSGKRRLVAAPAIFAPNSEGKPSARAAAEVIAAAVMVRPLNCIVAVSQNMGIGKNGDLPWPMLRYYGRTGFGTPRRFAESRRALGGHSGERVGPPAAAPAGARGDPPAVPAFAQRRPGLEQSPVTGQHHPSGLHRSPLSWSLSTRDRVPVNAVFL